MKLRTYVSLLSLLVPYFLSSFNDDGVKQQKQQGTRSNLWAVRRAALH